MTQVTKRTIKKTSAVFLILFGFLAILFQKGLGIKQNSSSDVLSVFGVDVAHADSSDGGPTSPGGNGPEGCGSSGGDAGGGDAGGGGGGNCE